MNTDAMGQTKKATCITESSYSEALTYGNRYEILGDDKEKRQLKVRGENGKIRWYPYDCFDLTGGEVPKLTRMVICDSLKESGDWVEVEIELSDGQRRWCYFLTPELLAQQNGVTIGDAGSLLSYHAPHMIVVSTLSQEMIEQALRYIQSQGVLLDCTKPL